MPPYREGGDRVTFTISKRNLERIALIILTVVITLLVAHWAGFGSCDGTGTSQGEGSAQAATAPADGGELIQEVVVEKVEQDEEPQIIETVVEPETVVVEPEPNDTVETEESDETEEEEEVELSGQINLVIDKIEYDQKGDDWGSIKRITVTVNNQKDRFEPEYYIYFWDKDTSQGDKNIVHGKVKSMLIPASIEDRVDVLSTSVSFINFDVEKTVKIELRNAVTGKAYASSTKTFTPTSD